MVDLLSIRNIELITEAQASINEYGADYTSGSELPMVKFEVWLDATDLNTYPGIPVEILGYQFKIVAMPVSITHSIFGIGFLGFNNSNPTYQPLEINNSAGLVAYASSEGIVDYDPSNDGVPTFRGIEKLVGVFYIKATEAEVIINLSEPLVVTDIGNIALNDIRYLQTPEFVDSRTYTKDPALPDGIAGSTYESLSDVSANNAGSFYLLELATGKLFNATKTGSLAAEYYNCGYTCSYLVLTNWALGTEVIEFNRPDNLYAPESTVANPVYTLT